MSWESKVVWQEGLFLQPHHFQQQDRYIEALVAGVATGVAPYAWGVRELTLDDALLKLGKIAVKSCSGLTPDGAVFRIPQNDDHPAALDVPETVKNAVVYLATPIRRQGTTEVGHERRGSIRVPLHPCRDRSDRYDGARSASVADGRRQTAHSGCSGCG